MNSIAGFLQKFLNLEKDNNTKLLLILDAIKQKTGLELTKEILEIKGETLKVNCNPVFRNEIFMHKSEIEDLLKNSKIYLKII
ncbi:MAG: hypothetical protein A2431_02990 [Candidatus Zambryskibacteria bacterium RIFOXYC1_FULL_39_10]|uniref:Uncharacterized protein n=1 Tax=Candidatus Zambryskibacteria bacterium RIFOXYC1_FULL_39_10 TaxID=1802779 RepID=A0A1G2V030_9BACT|nr:MAG: hypothetical protein A2605_02080 [Candidatus Zambryskibacteria bacterium RIFOXYD1_FULL_39_35]OHB14989.1 MAG: hypothetical protein A2431_02990 [Candidatus Zambryskibacteria bacterium RIFOXYC1_FULL_39_10]